MFPGNVADARSGPAAPALSPRARTSGDPGTQRPPPAATGAPRGQSSIAIQATSAARSACHQDGAEALHRQRPSAPKKVITVKIGLADTWPPDKRPPHREPQPPRWRNIRTPQRTSLAPPVQAPNLSDVGKRQAYLPANASGEHADHTSPPCSRSEFSGYDAITVSPFPQRSRLGPNPGFGPIRPTCERNDNNHTTSTPPHGRDHLGIRGRLRRNRHRTGPRLLRTDPRDRTVERAPLAPPEDCEFAEWRLARRATDYHAGSTASSIPCRHRLILQQVDLRAMARTVEIFRRASAIAAHQRRYGGPATALIPQCRPPIAAMPSRGRIART